MYMPPGFADALARKYAILQQQADATTKNAATTALVGGANAALDTTRNRLLPDQAAAEIAKTKADTGLVGEQAKYFGKTALANIANLGSSTNLNNTNASRVRLNSVDTDTIDPDSIDMIRKMRASRGFQFSDLGSNLQSRPLGY